MANEITKQEMKSLLDNFYNGLETNLWSNQQGILQQIYTALTGNQYKSTNNKSPLAQTNSAILNAQGTGYARHSMENMQDNNSDVYDPRRAGTLEEQRWKPVPQKSIFDKMVNSFNTSAKNGKNIEYLLRDGLGKKFQSSIGTIAEKFKGNPVWIAAILIIASTLKNQMESLLQTLNNTINLIGGIAQIVSVLSLALPALTGITTFMRGFNSILKIFSLVGDILSTGLQVFADNLLKPLEEFITTFSELVMQGMNIVQRAIDMRQGSDRLLSAESYAKIADATSDASFNMLKIMPQLRSAQGGLTKQMQDSTMQMMKAYDVLPSLAIQYAQSTLATSTMFKMNSDVIMNSVEAFRKVGIKEFVTPKDWSETTIQFARMANYALSTGVSLDKLGTNFQKASEYIYRFAVDSLDMAVEKMTQLVVQTEKYGISIEKVMETQKNLWNFERAAEMTAQLMQQGIYINPYQAFGTATGGTPEQMQLMLRDLASQGWDIRNLPQLVSNLAEAFGTSYDEMQRMIYQTHTTIMLEQKLGTDYSRTLLESVKGQISAQATPEEVFAELQKNPAIQSLLLQGTEQERQLLIAELQGNISTSISQQNAMVSALNAIGKNTTLSNMDEVFRNLTINERQAFTREFNKYQLFANEELPLNKGIQGIAQILWNIEGLVAKIANSWFFNGSKSEPDINAINTNLRNQYENSGIVMPIETTMVDDVLITKNGNYFRFNPNDNFLAMQDMSKALGNNMKNLPVQLQNNISIKIDKDGIVEMLEDVDKGISVSENNRTKVIVLDKTTSWMV